MILVNQAEGYSTYVSLNADEQSGRHGLNFVVGVGCQSV